MLLIAKNKDAWIYQREDVYLMRVTKEGCAKRGTSLFAWVGSKIGRFTKYDLIRGDKEVNHNGHTKLINLISIDYRTHNLIIFEK